MSTTTSRGRKKSTSTGSNKHVGVTGTRKNSEQNTGSVDHASQARIKELEQQVSDLKKRLDDLRKAKNTTIVRKDKEYVAVGTSRAGQLDAKSDQTDCAFCKEQLNSLETELRNQNRWRKEELQRHLDDIAALKETHKAEVEDLKQQSERQAKVQASSSEAGELEDIRSHNKNLQKETEELKSKVVELQLQIDDLLEELSRKEAEWCTKEEKLVLEMKTSWGAKYQQWMAQTEQKIVELQTSNNFLKSLLERQTTEDK